LIVSLVNFQSNSETTKVFHHSFIIFNHSQIKSFKFISSIQEIGDNKTHLTFLHFVHISGGIYSNNFSSLLTSKVEFIYLYGSTLTKSSFSDQKALKSFSIFCDFVISLEFNQFTGFFSLATTISNGVIFLSSSYLNHS